MARRHTGKLDWSYVERVIRELCELGEDMAPWQRLEQVRSKARN